MSRFNQGLPRAAKLPREMFGPGRVWVMNLGLSVLSALSRGMIRHRGPSGQRIWHFPAKSGGKRPVLLWVHGGGLVIGAPATEIALAKHIRDTLDIHVVTPGYRLAGRAPFPAASDDLVAALEWVCAQPWADAEKIAVGGDSAGGGLAACLAIRARNEDGPRIAFQLLHEPMLDNESGAEAARTPPPEDMRLWSARMNQFGWKEYLRGQAPQAPVPETASAARLADPKGLPPAWIGVGDADLFHDECLAYADTLSAAGIPVQTHVLPGAYHGFMAMEPDAAPSRAYRAEMIRALATGLGLVATSDHGP